MNKKLGISLNVARAALAATAAAAMGAALIGQTRVAQALPVYAKKEGKPCAYCHVKATGGGKRNAAGIYYGSHGHSFAGYAPAENDPNPPTSAKKGGATAAATTKPSAKPSPKAGAKSAAGKKVAKPSPKPSAAK